MGLLLLAISGFILHQAITKYWWFDRRIVVVFYDKIIHPYCDHAQNLPSQTRMKFLPLCFFGRNLARNGIAISSSIWYVRNLSSFSWCCCCFCCCCLLFLMLLPFFLLVLLFFSSLLVVFFDARGNSWMTMKSTNAFCCCCCCCCCYVALVCVFVVYVGRGLFLIESMTGNTIASSFGDQICFNPPSTNKTFSLNCREGKK